MRVEVVRCVIRPAHVAGGHAIVADVVGIVAAAVAARADAANEFSVQTVPFDMDGADETDADGVTIVWTYDDGEAEA